MTDAARGAPRLRPAVCTNRSLDVIGACLDALAAAGLGGDSIVVLSGADGAAAGRRAEILERLPGATVVAEPAPGLSAARNRALATAEAADAIAYVDDDAVIGPRWRETLARAWAGADAATGAIGGPVRPQFLDRRPPWLSDHLLLALSIVDHGGEPKDLDAGSGEYLYGANMSCAVGPMRAIGGFDPALGPVGDAPGFGDDVEAQRRLAAAGYRVRYEPEAFVWHRIAATRLRRREMLRRRYRDGLSRGRMDPPPTVRTALQLVAVGGRGVVDYVRRDEASAMTRASYAVECAGVLRQRLAGGGARQRDA